jgi:pyruvate/2-oxoglutarate dehydrogenase complex dihydrolipoamide acyltransferase (E2) component
MKFTLSFDARAVSEEEAAAWLQTFKGLLERPNTLLL